MEIAEGMMKKHQTIRLICLTLSFFLCAPLLSGCAIPPDEEIVKTSIAAYFEARNYKVIGLEVADIEPVPLNKKVYMGTEGYIVNIRLITLEAIRGSAKSGSLKEKERLKFRNAVFRVREKTGERGIWEVSVISGIPLL